MNWQKTFFHLVSFLILFYLLIATQLNKFILLIAVVLLLINLYNLFNLIINPQTQKNFTFIKQNTKKSQKYSQSRFNITNFQNTVRNAFQKSLNKNNCYIEEENKYWNNTHFSKSDKIEQLKDIRLTDLRRQTSNRFSEDTSLKQQGLNIKRLRNYLEIKEVQNAFVIKKIRQVMLQKFSKFGQAFKKIKLEENQIKQMLFMIDQYINNKISFQYDKIIEDYTEINSFLHKCFSLSLSLTGPSSSSAIDYFQLIQIANLIDKKDIIPNRCLPNLPPHQIKKELQSVKRNISSLPNFSLPANILKFQLFFKYLKQDFKDQSLFFSRMENLRGKEVIQGKSHVFKCQQNDYIYYNRQTSIKSRCTSTAVLSFLCCNLQKYYKSNKYLIKEIALILNI